jgi:hypothetical protein
LHDRLHHSVALAKTSEHSGHEVAVKQFVDLRKRAEALTGSFSGFRRCPDRLGRERGLPLRQARLQIAVAGTTVFLAGIVVGNH